MLKKLLRREAECEEGPTEGSLMETIIPSGLFSLLGGVQLFTDVSMQRSSSKIHKTILISFFLFITSWKKHVSLQYMVV